MRTWRARCSPRSPTGMRRSGWRSRYERANHEITGRTSARYEPDAGMTAQPRPNLGGLFDGSTPADRTSSIAGRLGPRLVTTPAGLPPDDATSASHTVDQAGDTKEPKSAAPAASPQQRSIDPVVWLDPIRALELYF